MTDWGAVLGGGAAGTAYLGFLAFLPGLRGLRWTAVPLVLGAGLIAGATAGVAAGGGPDRDATPRRIRAGAWHGLLAGSLAGAAFAGAFVLLLRTHRPPGVFYGMNYLLATSAGRFPVIATDGELVLAGLAGAGWSLIAALGLVAGGRAPKRESHGMLE